MFHLLFLSRKSPNKMYPHLNSKQETFTFLAMVSYDEMPKHHRSAQFLLSSSDRKLQL